MILKRILPLILCLISALGCFAEDYIVKASSLNLRVAPSKTAAVACVADEYEILDVQEISGDWALVNYQGETLYAAAQYLQYLPPVPEPAKETRSEGGWLSGLSGSGGHVLINDWFRNYSDAPLWISLVILAFLSIIFFTGVERYENPTVFYSSAFSFLVLCVLEIVHFLGYQGDKTWFCSPSRVGWIMTVINFLLFGFVCYIQLITYIHLTQYAHYHGDREMSNKPGYIMSLAAIVSLIISGIFFSDSVNIVITIALFALLGWIGWMVYCNVRDGGSWPNLVLTVFLWVVGALGTLLLLFNFLVLMILVACAFLVLYIFSAVSSASSSSSSSSSPSQPSNGPEEERTFLRDRYGNDIEVDVSAFGDSATEKGVIGGRKFRKTSQGWVEK